MKPPCGKRTQARKGGGPNFRFWEQLGRGKFRPLEILWFLPPDFWILLSLAFSLFQMSAYLAAVLGPVGHTRVWPVWKRQVILTASSATYSSKGGAELCYFEDHSYISFSGYEVWNYGKVSHPLGLAELRWFWSSHFRSGAAR